MSWDRVEGNWKQFKGKVKEEWGDLTDNEITEAEGNREKLEGRIQEISDLRAGCLTSLNAMCFIKRDQPNSL